MKDLRNIDIFIMITYENLLTQTYLVLISYWLKAYVRTNEHRCNFEL